MTRIAVAGKRKDHEVLLYALSTCGWCKKTKQYLKDNDVAFEYIDVDLAEQDERKRVIEDLKARKAPLGFPIIIIDDERLIVGYKPDEIREALEF